MNEKILLFIPAYNCQKQLPRVLEKIHLASLPSSITEILIIDNCSVDNTIQEGIEASKKLNIPTTILRNNENYSLGGSIKRAFLYAIEQKYDYLIVLHGDDQADIHDILGPLEKKLHLQNDLLIGARFHAESQIKGYSWERRLGNIIMNKVFSWVVDSQVDDMIAGINCFNISFFKSMFFLPFPNNLTFDAHVLLYAFDANARISYFPITWREEDQISNAKVVKQAFIILRLLVKYLFLKKRTFTENNSGYSLDFNYPSQLILSDSVAKVPKDVNE